MKKNYKSPQTMTMKSAIRASLLCGSGDGNTSFAPPRIDASGEKNVVDNTVTLSISQEEYAGECCSRVRFQF